MVLFKLVFDSTRRAIFLNIFHGDNALDNLLAVNDPQFNFLLQHIITIYIYYSSYFLERLKMEAINENCLFWGNKVSVKQ